MAFYLTSDLPNANTMNLIRLAQITVTATILHAAPTFAGQYEIGAAKGLMVASILHEKCTGKRHPDDEMKRQFKMLMAQGFSVKDIEQGFNEGNFYAESKYPDYQNKKPPKSECDSAIRLYNESMKFM